MGTVFDVGIALGVLIGALCNVVGGSEVQFVAKAHQQGGEPAILFFEVIDLDLVVPPIRLDGETGVPREEGDECIDV